MSTSVPSSPTPKLPPSTPFLQPGAETAGAARPSAPVPQPAAKAATGAAVPDSAARPAADRYIAHEALHAAAPPAGGGPVLHRTAAVPAASAWGPEACKPPRDVLLPWDLRGKGMPTEASLLKLNDGHGALFAVGEWKPGARPLVLVHGIDADFADLQPLVDRFRNDPDRQLLVYAYDDKDRYTDDNGIDLGKELRALRERYPWTGQLDIVAHSMGGIIARRGLNELAAGPERGIERFSDIRFVAVDTPWHGFPGPGWRLPFFRGAMDMQANSGMFQGHQGAQDEAARRGVVGVPLPPSVQVHLVSADNTAGGGKPDSILDYTDTGSNHFGADLAHLSEAVRRYLQAGPAARDGRWAKDLDVYAANYLKALQSDSSWPAAEAELRDLLDQEKLEPQWVGRVLARHMPRYAGEHTGVLSNAELLRDLHGLLG